MYFSLSSIRLTVAGDQPLRDRILPGTFSQVSRKQRMPYGPCERMNTFLWRTCVKKLVPAHRRTWPPGWSTISQERSPQRWRDPPQEFVAWEVAEPGCGHIVCSIWPRRLGRKSPALDC